MFADGNMFAGLFAAHAAGPLFTQTLPFLLIAVAVVVGACLVIGIAGRGRAEPKSRWSLWEWLVYAATLGSVTILAVTSFGALLVNGHLGSWALFFHMVGAGAFVFTLPVLAVTWCEPSCFDLRRYGERGQTAPPRFYWLPKLMFWVVLPAGWIVSMTMLVSMLPLLGTEGLNSMTDLHRWSGLIVVAAVALHLSGVVLQRIGRR
ncbi:MAG: hypothetical protein KJ000_29675 [Pirellulaceae bacterium]|nr:hypothetical protein [Pirellulaceae bacterium]